MPKKYKGEGRGHGMAAVAAALDDAWQKAKDGGSGDKKLRVDVEEWYVRGENPINWSSIVLIDDDA